jgi:hypothetical protein
MLIKSKDLTGYLLKGIDGDFGTVKEFFFDDFHWAVRYLVADTGTWLSGRQVLISPFSFGVIHEKSRHISVKLTKIQIEGSPALSSDLPVSKQFEADYHAHYDWPAYWSGPYLWGTTQLPQHPFHNQKTLNSDEKEWNPRLRSISAVTGYTIQSSDGTMGRVVDFVIDAESWAIRYLVVDTADWWPGRQVLIAVRWIDKVSWELSKIFVELTRAEIKHSPEFTPATLLTREYEVELHGHFNREGYWLDPIAPEHHD